MNTILAVGALACVTVACGADAHNVTSQGVLVEDLSGAFTVADIDAAIEAARELAPAQYRDAFAKLDGYQLRVMNAKHVEACASQGRPLVIGCAVPESGLIIVAHRGCSDLWTTRSTIAHEIGHVVLGDPDHTRVEWFGAGGVEERAIISECGDLTP